MRAAQRSARRFRLRRPPPRVRDRPHEDVVEQGACLETHATRVRMPVIAVSNQKGGVGKTTSTLNLGAALQAVGKRVLLVDLDPQGNLSTAAGLLHPEGLSPSIGDLLVQTARSGGRPPDTRGAIIQSPAGLPIIPANSQLSAAELALVSA